MPDQNHIEISVFSPGYGESILIHIGNGDWIVVDSCSKNRKSPPVALEYLNSLGANPKECVKLIVVSHWHDDHVRGLANLCEECESAQLLFSSSIRCKEFLALSNVCKNSVSGNITSGIEEFAKAIEILFKSGRKEKISWAMADRVVWNNSGLNSEASLPCTVTSLSPSDLSFTEAQENIFNLLQQSIQNKNLLRPKDINANNVSVVLHVKIGELILLLGGDLEETRSSGTGWSVIVSSTRRPTEKAAIFKVPHHGSSTAESEDVWQTLLAQNPVSVLTGFKNGRCSLPTEEDIQRIASKSGKLFMVSPPRLKTISRPRLVEKTIREVGARVYPVTNNVMGQVRIQLIPGMPLDDWEICLFESAQEL